MSETFEIVWHGRGGQGAVTAAKIYTEAAFYEGFKGVSAKPTYFSERRGAPVSVHTRISRQPIRTYSNIALADVAVALDDNLLEMINVTANLKEGGALIVNSRERAADIPVSGPYTLATADAFHSSEEAGLVIEGNVLISTSILGPVAATCDLVSLESLKVAIESKFRTKPGHAERNIRALELAYQATDIIRAGTPAKNVVA